ncbi:MAG: glycosyltransferase family 2 protein [Nostoc sp.]|uniref:glycosyltransferase family 2 protein n=1 Tax=Nostoc sp. TaxID=1180 RepID=UPI002FF5668F
MMKTPVAFLIFNRPDTTAEVFAAIRQAKPPKLLVVADGPRNDRPGEAEKCVATRAIIEAVDWECEVIKNYSDTNLGCKKRVSTGIDWVFRQVEEAIILEDDCLPNPTFFNFCEEMLERYRNDNRVMHISGCNYGITGSIVEHSYYFSKMTGGWGWATWRRAWQWNDVDITFWPELVKQTELLRSIFSTNKELEVRLKNWQDVYDGNRDTVWDYSWHLSCISQGGLSIKPNQNLVSNIGFGVDATHTKSTISHLANLQTESMLFPLKHPIFMLYDSGADKRYFQTMYTPGLLNKIILRLKSGMLSYKKLN